MNSEDNIKKLTEMGFSEDQAITALKITKNDVEAAIAYLFEDPIEIDTPNNNELVTYNDSVNVLNPKDIPDLSLFLAPSQSYGGYSDVQYSGQEEIEKQDEDIDFQHYEYYEQTEPGCLYEDISNMQRDNDCKAIISKRSGFLENYYIPIITILSQLAQFKSMFLRPLDSEFQYDPGWAIGKPYSIDVPSNLDELKVSSYKFFIELQKIIGYLDGESKRLFISGDNLVSNLPSDIKKRLVFNKIETVDELLPKLYESLQDNYDKMFGHYESLDRLFKSSVESVNEELINNIYTFDVDVEYRHRTLYESFNELFWGSELEMLGNIRLIDTAKVLTIQLVGDEDSYVESNFELDEFFYPQLYSSSYFPFVNEMNKKRNDIIKQRTKLSNEIMQLNSFEGKKVKGFLDMAIQYLRAQDSDIEDLNTLSKEIGNQKLRLTENLESLNKQYANLDVRNYENIVKQIARLDVKPLTKYTLLGVILSDVEYYYRSSQTGSWIYQKGIYSSNNIIIDYELDESDFATIRQDVLQYSSSGVKPILLIYVADDVLKEGIGFENTKLHDFFTKDNSKFQEQISEFHMKTSQNDSNMDDSDEISEELTLSKKNDLNIDMDQNALIDL